MGSKCSRESRPVGVPGAAPVDGQAPAKESRHRSGSGGSGSGDMGGTTSGGRRSRHKMTLSRALFINHGEGGLEENYEVGEKAGEGTQGIVFVAKRRSDQSSHAVKKVMKSTMRGADMQAFHKEIEIMKSMDHPNIVKLYDTFEDKKSYYLVMELCSGGELLDKIVAQGHLTEAQAAVVVQQVLRAVFYMHENGYVHRDLKPENFLLAHNGPISEDNLLKLIDFGIACECGPTQMLHELVGTPFYVAPQVVTKRYDKRCDLWSVGVIMYTLLSGTVPFNGTDQEILQKVRVGIVNYPEAHWASVSEDAQKLVKCLLTRNAEKRISAEDALHHPWITCMAPRATEHLPEDLVRNLLSFRRVNVVKKAALQIIVGEMDDTELQGLRRVFTSMDANSDGKLTVAEMLSGMKDAGFDLPDHFEEVLASIDTDGSGIVDYTEFLAATLDRRSKTLPEQACHRAFGKFDKDHDGRIQVKEIVKALAGGDPKKERMFEKEAAEVVSQYGTSVDGTMDFPEFYKMLTSCSRQRVDETPSRLERRALPDFCSDHSAESDG